ncbi:MAG: acetylornithine deacetylase [Bradymonadia bacterium]|jgi:acetylornithine deacetylase
MNLDTLLEWLSVDSTTNSEAEYLQVLERTLAADGLTVTRQHVADDRWNLLALSEGPTRLLLNTHVDTVPPFFGPTIDGEKIRARGACDTKGGLFAMWTAWRALPAPLRSQIGFSLVVGEEVDHIGAKVAAAAPVDGIEMIVMCEPTRNRLSRGQKGILKIRLHASGQAGHSAFPETGHSAVHTLIAACARLQAASWPRHEELGETTFNIGVIQGGVAANVFAPAASAEILFRVVSDLESLQAQVRDCVGDEIRIEEIASNDAMALKYWGGFETDVVPFNTDAPYLGKDTPVVLVGPGDIRTAHSPDEHLSVPDLEAGVALYDQLFRGILDGSLA